MKMNFLKELLLGIEINKTMMIGIVIGFGLNLIPWRRTGIKFDSFMDKIFGVKTSEKLQEKIKKLLEEFMKGMDDNDSVEVNVNVKRKAGEVGTHGIISKKSFIIKAVKNGDKIVISKN